MAADSPSTIGEHSKRCLELFTQNADAARDMQHGDASRVKNGLQDEFARFKLWTSNIGVFADVHASLDFRVRELPDVAELFLRQLDTIGCRLDQLHEDVVETQHREKKTVEGQNAVDPFDPFDPTEPVAALDTEKPDFKNWDSIEILQSIHESIDWLHRLSNLVRKASFANQNRRAKEFRLRDSEGRESEELTEAMTSGLREVYKHVIKRNTKDLEGYLADRLIETMIIRHKRILYRRSRQIRWAIAQVQHLAKRVESPKESWQQHLPGPVPLIQEPKPLKSTPGSTVERSATPIQDRATTLNVATYRKGATPSQLSRATSAPLKQQDQRLVPPPPRAAREGKDFVCPYCCLILQSGEAWNRKAWTNHVKKDLDPYFCVFEECDNPSEIYSSSKEWLSHMRNRHRMGWQCFATDHEPLVYDRPEEFEEHMKTDHAGSFPDDQLPFIVEISAQPITPTLEHCPFCSETADNLEEHVGQHLQEFALHSLPWPDDVKEGSQDGSEWQSDITSSKKETRETVKEARDSSSFPIFDNVSESDETSNTEAGDRLTLYGYLPEIAVQHEPLCIEVLENKEYESVAAFACTQYRADSTQALAQRLVKQAAASTSTTNFSLSSRGLHTLESQIEERHACHNVTFDPVDETGLRLEAVLHPDFYSLERSAKLRDCRLCLAIHRMIQVGKQGIFDPNQKVSLALQYKDKAEDAHFFFIDDEIGLNDGDSPPFLLIDSPETGLYFQIQNPDVISMSSLRHGDGGTTASADDPGHVHPALEGVSSDDSTGSDASMALMRSWIRTCEKDHQTCGKKASGSSFIYPKRLLDVSKVEAQSGSAFLVLSAQSNLHNTRPPYATLSYRWKPGHSCGTYASTEQKYVQDGIPAGALTKTFREAAITTQKLGLRYLWIDSLCIVQDLDDDRADEIPKIADYYQNADFNIADATESTDGGLFYERDGEANRPLHLPVTINTPDFPVTTRKVVLELSPILRARTSHLDTRGWTLLERIFPRGTFFFNPYWVSFECAEMSASESCPRGVAKDLATSLSQLEDGMATIVSRRAALSTIGGFLRARYKEVSEGQKLDEAERAKVYRLWFAVLTEYCSRDLTMESDRLYAISPLATRLSHILRDEYVAGIWKGNLLQCLWWGFSNEPPHHLPVRSKQCGAPTWSWASLCYTSISPRYMRRRFGFFKATSIIPRVQIQDLTWKTLGSSQSSNVSNAKLTLSGGLLPGYVYLRGKEDDYIDLVTVTEGLKSRPKSRQRRHLFDGTADWRMHICAESSGQRDRVTVQVFPDASDGIVEGYFYLLPLAESTGSGDWVPGKMPPKVEDGHLFGLVLKENTEGTFQRVGCVETKADLLMATNDRDVVLV